MVVSVLSESVWNIVTMFLLICTLTLCTHLVTVW